MGNSKSKVARKTLRENIKTGLIKELKESTAQFVKSSKKLDKLIDKSSEKLAKKLSRKLKLNKSAKAEFNGHTTVSSEPAKSSGKIISKQRRSTSPAKIRANAAIDGSKPTTTDTLVKKPVRSRKTTVVAE